MYTNWPTFIPMLFYIIPKHDIYIHFYKQLMQTRHKLVNLSLIPRHKEEEEKELQLEPFVNVLNYHQLNMCSLVVSANDIFKVTWWIVRCSCLNCCNQLAYLYSLVGLSTLSALVNNLFISKEF